MRTRKRPWGVVAGPIIFFGGLAVFLGVNKATDIKDVVEHWGHELQHSSAPVVMEMPVYVPLLVGGDWLGRLETVIVQRDRPGGVDGLRLIARVRDDKHLVRLDGCALRLRIRRGNVGELKRALRCVSDTKGLISFGNLEVRGTSMEVPVLVSRDDLPCHDTGIHVGPCDHFQQDLEVQMRGLAEELRATADEFRDEARRIKTTVKAELRDKVRGIR